MKEKKRLEITLESHELTIVRFSQNRNQDFCAVCRRHTPHFSLAESVSVLALDEASIFQMAESGKLHGREASDGRFFLCGASLARSANR